MPLELAAVAVACWQSCARLEQTRPTLSKNRSIFT